jgi:flagellar hook-associated protein 1 FlgK
MALDGAVNAAMSGLQFMARQMNQAADNIANAQTGGYTAKRVIADSVTQGGVRTIGVQRQVDNTLRAEARVSQSDAAAAGMRARFLGPLASLQGDPQAASSLGGLVGALRDSFLALRGSPSSSVAQSAVIQAATILADRFNTQGETIARTRQSVHDQLNGDVDEMNRVLSEVARLDSEARSARGAGVDDAATLDRRDAALNRLSELIEVRAVTGEDGSTMLILRGGSTIPLSRADAPFSLAAAQISPESHSGPGGGIPGLKLFGDDVTATLKGGRVGAALEMRDKTLPLMQAELDVTAAALATRFDAQGLRLFTVDGKPSEDGPPPNPSSGYAGNIVGFAQRIAVSRDVESDRRLVRDGTPNSGGFAPNPATGPSGFLALIDAVTNWTFGGVSNAAGAPHPALPTTGLGPNRDLSLSFSVPAQITDQAAALAAGHSNLIATATDRAEGAGATLTRIGALLAQREGVDVDSEVAMMLQLQTAYTANARVLSVVQQMWDTLFAAIR